MVKPAPCRRITNDCDDAGFTLRYDRDRLGRLRRYLNVVPSEKSLARLLGRLRELVGRTAMLEATPRVDPGTESVPDRLGCVLRAWLSVASFSQGQRVGLRESVPAPATSQPKTVPHSRRPNGLWASEGSGFEVAEMDSPTPRACPRLNHTGKPYAGNPHVRFDEGGRGERPFPTRLLKAVRCGRC